MVRRLIILVSVLALSAGGVGFAMVGGTGATAESFGLDGPRPCC